MNWIDICIIAILIINIGLGWSRGFIRSVTNLVSMILGFICAKLYHAQMYDFLNEQYDLFSKIKATVSQTFSNVSFPEMSTLEALSPNELAQKMGETEYLKVITEKFFESDKFEMMLANNVQNFSEGFSSWLAENILTILSMIVVFLIAFIGVRIIGYFLSGIFKLPLLNGVNKLSGLLFGLAKGTFFAMLFVLILVVFGPLFNHGNVIDTLETSTIGIYMYKYNLIMIIFESMI